MERGKSENCCKAFSLLSYRWSQHNSCENAENSNVWLQRQAHTDFSSFGSTEETKLNEHNFISPEERIKKRICAANGLFYSINLLKFLYMKPLYNRKQTLTAWKSNNKQ